MINFLWHKIVRAGSCACSGIYQLFSTEWAFAIELIIFFALLPFVFYLTHINLERALLIGVLVMVLVTEALNSGIEAAVDFTSTHEHPLAKRAKDAGAAAVLLAVINAITVWLLILVK